MDRKKSMYFQFPTIDYIRENISEALFLWYTVNTGYWYTVKNYASFPLKNGPECRYTILMFIQVLMVYDIL